MIGNQNPEWWKRDSDQARTQAEFQQELQDQWVWLFRKRGQIADRSVGQYSALLSADRVEASLKNPGWDASIGSGGFGFTEYFATEDEEHKTLYERYPTDGIELLVNYREFHGVRPSEWEPVEEFRLLFNLWEDRRTKTYYVFDESGNPQKVVVVDEGGVRALSTLVRRFQAAKQMHLALYLDSTRQSDDLPENSCHWKESDEFEILSYDCSGLEAMGRRFSRLLGKRIFPPPPVEACGIPPYDERNEDYEEFTITVSETGDEIVFSSDPDQLANYFGANPQNPHYLTPVYFRREVLNKYYGDSERFTVEDGYIHCAGLWGLRIDNDQPDHVMVFLGDLGRDIPRAEARYFRSFNIPPPEEGPSETLIRRAFGGQFADAKSLDLRFPRLYTDTNEAWERAFGWALFKPLHKDDLHVLDRLHIPATDGAAEFDDQILHLAKLVVDSLNEEALAREIGGAAEGVKGIAKLERFLGGLGIDEPRTLLRPLANVQGLRSRASAHRKGSNFDVTTAIGEVGRRAGFERLLGETIETIEALADIATRRSETQIEDRRHS